MDDNETKIATLYGRIIIMALLVLCSLYGINTTGLTVIP